MLYNVYGDYMKIKEIFGYTENRKWYINLIICILCLLGILIIPSMIAILLSSLIKNENIVSDISQILFIILLVLIYYKDLKREFKLFKKDFGTDIKRAIKYYVIGLMCMIFFNLCIFIILGDISSNETQVREMLFSDPGAVLINIMLLAPICEELVFRKSVSTVFKNKWVYALMCGLLFGMAHLLTNIVSGIFVISDLLYLLPYGSLGFFFALMDHESKSVFPSICVHAFHNTCTGLLLLYMFKMGAM